MLKLDLAKWNQTPEDLRVEALTAAHARTRERFLALYELTQQGHGITAVARGTTHHAQTLMRWVHWYNDAGPEGLVFQHTGGLTPFFCQVKEQALDALLRAGLAAAAAPTVDKDLETGRLAPSRALEQHTAPPRWTLKRLVTWIGTQFGHQISRETLRQALKRLGFSWKKAKALLNRATTAARAAFVVQLQALLARTLKDEPPLIVYVDEAHIHQEADLGYGWAPVGERLWVGSHTPGLSAKVSFYGLYFYNHGQVAIWDFPRGNTDHTLTVLRRLRECEPTREIVLSWDGASYHRAGAVVALAAELAITLLPLPSYSPDFMPVEALWRWLREDVTYHHCHASAEELITRVRDFAKTINLDPFAIADRLWTRTSLDPEEEKLRIPC